LETGRTRVIWWLLKGNTRYKEHLPRIDGETSPVSGTYKGRKQTNCWQNETRMRQSRIGHIFAPKRTEDTSHLVLKGNRYPQSIVARLKLHRTFHLTCSVLSVKRTEKKVLRRNWQISKLGVRSTQVAGINMGKRQSRRGSCQSLSSRPVPGSFGWIAFRGLPGPGYGKLKQSQAGGRT
jgi:hypothetical protein